MYKDAIRRPVLAFLSDFGLSDGFVGVMKGVVLGIVPGAQLVDITHEIGPQQVAQGAWLLGTSYAYFPKGTVFVCVVDPGVGGERGAVAMQAGEWFFVGPDNGLFGYVLAEQPVHEAVALANPAYQRAQVSSTFHGRDIFAPVAAHIAAGTRLAHLGPVVNSSALCRLDSRVAERQGEHIVGRVVHVDHFGNLITNIPLRMVPDLFSSPTVQLTFETGGIVVSQCRRFFSEAGEDGEDGAPFMYGDSSGYVGVAVRNGSAAQVLGVGYGVEVTLVGSVDERSGISGTDMLC